MAAISSVPVVRISEPLAQQLEPFSTDHTPNAEIAVRCQVLGSPGVDEEYVKKFSNELSSALQTMSCTVVSGFESQLRYAVMSLVSSLLGGLSGTISGRLGGEVTEVVTSNILDHNQAWHTDSTSWSVPNRWQILALVTPDRFGRAAPTSILRWTNVLDRLGGIAQQLSTRKLAWRQQFPELPPLEAPILGHPPRWLRPALAPYLDDSGRFDDLALDAIDRAIRGAHDWFDCEITRSTLLVFDNYAVLHRGPKLEPDGGRTVLRIKLGGRCY